ncbi:MAG: tryptophan--tRNA ligase [Patescibacteria group bacterium]
MPKPILISGIQPTGRLHLGNYLGALKNFVELQNSGKYQCYFFIADLHALTENPIAKDSNNNIINLTADFLAAGLDPKKSVIFQQSQILAHETLAKILESIAPFGELRRMTQFKEKSEGEKESANVGLFTYPILMAADILLYDAQFVPVGEDQLQHLELARTLTRKFNKKFGQTFMEPKEILTAIPRLMSLDDPTKKMSKSLPSGCVFIDDEPEVIEQKFRSAITDSGNEIKYDPKTKPEISNLLNIYSAVTGISIKELESQLKGQSYLVFKKALAQVVSDHFAAFRKKKSALVKKPAALQKVLQRGSGQARKVAEKKILEVKEKIGLI